MCVDKYNVSYFDQGLICAPETGIIKLTLVVGGLEGLADGSLVGLFEGRSVGGLVDNSEEPVGAPVVGSGVTSVISGTLGLADGPGVGALVGSLVGWLVGWFEGLDVG